MFRYANLEEFLLMLALR